MPSIFELVLIRRDGGRRLSAPPDQSPRLFDWIFETPANAPFDLQVAATIAALESIISVYPAFISHAQDL